MRKLLIILFAIALLAPQAFGQGCAEPASEEGINLFGYLQAQYDYNMLDNPESTFGFNRARIGVMGNIPYDFSYYVLLETSPFKKDGPKAYLLDAFITYNRFSFAKVSMGSFKTPFGLELGTPCQSLHTINRSKVVNELTAPDRDMGLMLLGGSDTTLLRYSVALMNGTGLLVKDEDTYKDVVGRVIVQPTDWLSFGGSFKLGKSENSDPSLDDDTRSRFGGDVAIDVANFIVQSEYIYGKDAGSSLQDGGCGGDPVVVPGNFKKSGMYITALYNTPWNIQPVIKYENYRVEKENASGGTYNQENFEQITTFGINYFFNEWTRLQVNYEYAAEQVKEIKNDRLMVQLQVRF